MALRDGAYLMPQRAGHEAALQGLADDCQREGGSAWLMSVMARSPAEGGSYRQLFDRADDYAELRRSWQEANRGLSALAVADLVRLQRRLQRDLDALQAIDFFPGDAALEAQAAWTELNKRIASLLSPDEPQETAGAIPRLDASQYQGRTWATRRRLWVDRVASAWLIRRFIDRDARFQWLSQPSDCPKGALGFDFDGAAFTHVGERVTFETLMASFDLEQDAALMRVAALVHQLDVGGEPVAEAAGFEAVLAGAHQRLDEDDALLAEMSKMLDSLYAYFQQAGGRPG